MEIVAVSTVDEAAGAAEDAQALIGFCNEEILAAGRELHWIQVYSSGVDRCVGNPGLHRGDKILTNGQRIASPALAEHAIALMMALVRGLDVYHRNQLAGEWKRDAGLAQRGQVLLGDRGPAAGRGGCRVRRRARPTDPARLVRGVSEQDGPRRPGAGPGFPTRR